MNVRDRVSQGDSDLYLVFEIVTKNSHSYVKEVKRYFCCILYFLRVCNFEGCGSDFFGSVFK